MLKPRFRSSLPNLPVESIKYFKKNDGDHLPNLSHKPKILPTFPMNKYSQEISDSVLKTILKQTILTPSAQALINFIYTRYIIVRIFLALFVLVSSGLASYLVVDSIITYFNFEVVTTVRTIYETPTLFPKVTFCNINSFQTKYAYELFLSGITPVHEISNEQKKLIGHELKNILIECWFRNVKCDAKDFTWSFSKR
jgi:hypothetical protein